MVDSVVTSLTMLRICSSRWSLVRLQTCIDVGTCVGSVFVGTNVGLNVGDNDTGNGEIGFSMGGVGRGTVTGGADGMSDSNAGCNVGSTMGIEIGDSDGASDGTSDGKSWFGGIVDGKSDTVGMNDCVGANDTVGMNDCIGANDTVFGETLTKKGDVEGTSVKRKLLGFEVGEVAIGLFVGVVPGILEGRDVDLVGADMGS
jgi:hypothetical protein